MRLNTRICFFFSAFFILFWVNAFSLGKNLRIQSDPDSSLQINHKSFAITDDFLELGRDLDLMNRMVYLGNSFSPALLDFNFNNTQNFLGTNQLSVYKKFKIKKLNFSKSNSEIVFKSATKKNVEFEINHVQRLGKQVLFDIDFLTARSLGFYSNQQTNFKKVNIGLEAKSKNERYVFTANYFNFKFANDESGGISSDSVFTNEIKSNTQLYESNLTSSNSVLIDKNWLVQNQFFLLKNNFYSDSLITTPSTELFLKSEFSYNRQSFLFNSDNREIIFENNFIDTNKTKDTLWGKSYSHKLSLNLTSKKNITSVFHTINTSIYFLNTAFNTGHYDFDSTFKVYRYGIRAEYSPITSNLNLGILAFNGSVVGKSNLNPYGTTVFVAYRLMNDFEFRFSFDAEKCIPSIIQNSYFSNHFVWKNNFSSYTVNRYSLSMYSSKFKSSLVANADRHKNFIYFDTQGRPNQISGSFNSFKISVSNKLELGKFCFENAVVYRNSSNINIYRVPAFTTLSNFYFSNKIFKNNLEIQPGLSFRYFTSFSADAYQPATGQFYLQNEVKIGDYPYFDIFINMNLKRVTVLFMLEHVNAGLSGRNYFTAPHYPAAGRTLRLMIKWNLVN